MKANLKGSGGIKGLALRHGEKIVITIVGLLALWFVYSSLNLPSLEDQYQADKLQEQITATNRAVTESTWPEGDSPDVRRYEQIEKDASSSVDPINYKIFGFDAPIVAATLLRGDPLVLNAVDVRAIGNSGLLAFRDEKTLAEQERRQKLKAEEQQKKLAKQQANDADQAAEGGRPGARRERGPEAEFNTEEFDPENPNRRLIEGVGSSAGVQLQGGERLERVYWATVVAKVPVREQLKLFQDAFQNARGYDAARDFPQYVGYIVERTEVVPGKQPEWTRVFVYDGQGKSIASKTPAGKFVNIDTVTKLGELATREWASPPIEPVDSRWTDMLLTLPLPPLVGRDFGADATHPDIPLAKNAPPLEVEPEPVPATGPAQKPADADDDTFNAGTGAVGQTRPGGGEYPMQSRSPRSAFGGRESGGAEGYSRRSFSPEDPGGGGSRSFRPEGGGANYGGGIASGQRVELPRGVDFLLLRFFDYTVQQGKEYKYRVKVVLNDPNAAIPTDAGVLESAVVDRRIKEAQDARANKCPVPFYRVAADWSEPSPAVGIPIGGTVHIAEAKLPAEKVHNDEPAVKLIAETFDIDPADGSAIHIAHEKEFRRGSVVNLKEKMRYTGDNDRWIDTKDTYELNTGVTVLDVEGANELSKGMTAPTRVLLMDIAGQLSVRDELTDSPEVQYLRLVFTDDKRKKGADQPGGEFGPEGGAALPVDLEAADNRAKPPAPRALHATAR